MSSSFSYLPLTTVFTPPSTCLSTIYLQFDGNYAVVPTDLLECYPSSAAQQMTFSPGICPYGYTPLSASVRYISGGTKTSALLPETDIACCPQLLHLTLSTDYCATYIAPTATAAAASMITQLPVFAFKYFSNVDVSNVPTTYTTTNSTVVSLANGLSTTVGLTTRVIQTTVPSFSTRFLPTPISTTFTFTSGYRVIYAQAIHVRAQSTDSAVISFFNAFLSGSANTTQISPSETPLPSPGLGGGAIAGIVVGAIAFLLLLLGALLLCLRKRKRRRVAGDAADNPNARHAMSELDGASKGIAELRSSPSQKISELRSAPTQRIAELHSSPITPADSAHT